MAHSMSRHKDNGSSPSGKAQDFDSCTRWFESSWPSYGRVAQVVEHLTFNQVVRGSNPRTLTYLVPWFSVGLKKCGCGGTGRRARFRFWWETVQVQVLLPADIRELIPECGERLFF